MRHVPGQHRAQVVGLPRSSARRAARRAAGKPAIIRWSNYHKKGSNFTQYSLFFFSPGRTTADRDRTGCTWPRKVARASIDFHDFSISFSMASKGRGPSLPVRPLRLLCDKNLIRRDEAAEVLDGGDHPFIKCAGSAPCVTLFAPSAVSFRE